MTEEIPNSEQPSNNPRRNVRHRRPAPQGAEGGAQVSSRRRVRHGSRGQSLDERQQSLDDSFDSAGDYQEEASVGRASRASRAKTEPQTKPGLSGKIDALRGKGVRAVAGLAPERQSKPPRKTRTNPIARLMNQWFDRVMGAVKEGGLSDQQEEYAAHKTTRDFVWNSLGMGAWGVMFPAVTMISTQLVGVEQAGMIAMAFVVGTLLMFLANFGVRTYQVSDVNEMHSFNDYQVNRWITCLLMVVVGVGYCMFRGYDATMFNISMGVFVYKMIDGLADVYEGRLQQVDKLYLAGISQAMRSIAALAVFAVALVITGSAVLSCFAMAVAAAITFVLVTYPLTLLETPKSERATGKSIMIMFKNTFPLFLALFLFNLIESMPKFVMEGMLTYDNQLYFNALYFPAQGILIMAQLVYKPLLVRMAGVWQDSSKRRKFDVILLGVLLLVVAITVGNLIIMAWIGVPVMGILYGIDFEQFRGLLYTMLVAGGITAAIDFLYQVVTVMRRQRDVTTLYCVTFGFSLFVPLLLVSFTGLPGAILSYLIVMSILFVLLVWEYLRIRRDLAQARRGAHRSQAAGHERSRTSFVTRGDGAFVEYSEEEQNRFAEEPEAEPIRPSEARARRERREEVMRRRTSNHRK